jgi:hypothetical protein
MEIPVTVGMLKKWLESAADDTRIVFTLGEDQPLTIWESWEGSESYRITFRESKQSTARI